MHTPRVEVRVERNWLTMAYVVSWKALDQADEVFAAGTETYGPLWEADQVERLVAHLTAGLVKVWLREPGT